MFDTEVGIVFVVVAGFVWECVGIGFEANKIEHSEIFYDDSLVRDFFNAYVLDHNLVVLLYYFDVEMVH